MTIRWIRKSEVKSRAGGISDATEWRWRQAGILPQPTYFGPRSPRWNEEEVDRAVEALRAQSARHEAAADSATAAAREARAHKLANRNASRLEAAS